MAKPFVDEGHRAVAQVPIALKSYRAGREPDPAMCVNCLIIVNDPSDRNPRPRLAVSNGASWDHVAWLTDVSDAPAAADIAGLVRAAIVEAMAQRQEAPRAMPPPLPASLQPTSETATDAIAVVAKAHLETHAALEVALQEIEELKQRVAFVEQRALARAEIVTAG